MSMLKTSICMSDTDLALIAKTMKKLHMESRSRFFKLACKNLIVKTIGYDEYKKFMERNSK